MALPRLTIKLFPPRPGKAYASSGHLTLPISDVHALAEWLLGQQGEYDNYLQQQVVRLLAFEFHNTSRGGTSYRSIQLRDPAELQGYGPGANAHAGSGNSNGGGGSPGLPPAAEQGYPGLGDEALPF
jgi:hypothetical protein